MSTPIESTLFNAVGQADGTLQRGDVKKLANRVGVITGGSTGMGLATARRFLEDGMDHVFITGRRKDVLDAAVAQLARRRLEFRVTLLICKILIASMR